MSHDSGHEGGDGSLVSRLRVIEGQPLADRAAAYAGLHEQLTRALESGAGAA